MTRTDAGYTAAEVRAAERPLLDAGVPLMARAARGLAEVCLRLPRRDVLVLAGSGNNGGDALYASAILAGRGWRVLVLPLGGRVHAHALAAARAAGAVVLPRDTSAGAVAAIASSSLVLDGLLGTGSSGGLRPPARQVVARIAEAHPGQVVAVDLPSGLDPDSGVAVPPVLRAAVTVTFGAVKRGLLRADGPRVAGRIALIDIGIGPELEALTGARGPRSAESGATGGTP